MVKTKKISKEVAPQKGKNIRFSACSHELLQNYCKGKGYNLGAFCEIGALEKMKRNIVESI